MQSRHSILPEQVALRAHKHDEQRMAEIDDEAYIALTATGAMAAPFSCTKLFVFVLYCSAVMHITPKQLPL